jgi:hypothetical protein
MPGSVVQVQNTGQFSAISRIEAVLLRCIVEAGPPISVAVTSQVLETDVVRSLKPGNE